MGGKAGKGDMRFGFFLEEKEITWVVLFKSCEKGSD